MEVLHHLPGMNDERLISGGGHVEDAAVYALEGDTLLLFTVDFFTPIVDDPASFGRIAAANAISDIYAMGGIPRLALNITSFPTRTNRLDEMIDILNGGAEKAMEAGCLIVGGHTIDDCEPKYGLSVIGFCKRDVLMTKSGLNPGDKLYLTKPLGTGIATTGLKRDLISASDIADIILSMETLNIKARDAAVDAGVKACTDISGFGLLGHLYEMLSESKCSAKIKMQNVPVFNICTKLASNGIYPGGTWGNYEFMEGKTRWHPSILQEEKMLLCDAQTSGGLLIGVSEIKRATLESKAEENGIKMERIGEIIDGDKEPRIEVCK